MNLQKSVLSNDTVVEANFTMVRETYRVIIGDEHFYRLMGDNTLYTFDKLVLPEDLVRFIYFMDHIETENNVVLRCMCQDGQYHWIALHKRAMKQAVDGKNLLDLELQDILIIGMKFDMYLQRVTKYRAILDIIDDKIFEYDEQTNLVTIYHYVNNRSEIIEKVDMQEWKNHILSGPYMENDQRESFERLCENMINGTEKFQVSFKSSFMSKGERKDFLTFRGETIYNGAERVLTVGIIKEHNSRMQSLVNDMYDVTEIGKDGATGLLNKKTSTTQMTDIIDKARNANSTKPMYLAVLDIDDFKQVNDTYGHMFGDKVILHFAKVIGSMVDGRGIAGRIGGDEFAILLDDVSSIEEVKIFLKTMRKKLKLELAQQQPGYTFSTSIGIAQYPQDGLNYNSLFRIADGCLYIAKEKGKDRYIIYDKERHGDIINMTMNQFKGNYCVKRLRPIERTRFFMKVLEQLQHATQSQIDEIATDIIEKMDVNGISIFVGREYACIRTFGSYLRKPAAATYLLDETYKTYFDENGVNKTNNIMSLAFDFPQVYKELQENRICSLLQMLFEKKDGTSLMIEIDIFGSVRRKWNDEDIALIYGLMRALADAI